MKVGPYRGYKTIGGKAKIALALMVILPYLFLFYFFINDEIYASDTVIIYVPIMLFSILSGYTLIRRSTDKVYFLSKEVARLESGEKAGPIQLKGDREINEIADHINSLLGRMDRINRKNQNCRVKIWMYSLWLLDWKHVLPLLLMDWYCHRCFSCNHFMSNQSTETGRYRRASSGKCELYMTLLEVGLALVSWMKIPR